MIVDGEKGHYTAIKNITRLLAKLNGKTKRAYHFCMNNLNGFRAESATDTHYECCSSNGQVKANMPTEKQKRLKFYDGQYQFMVPFILYADFQSISKSGDEPYREKINRTKAGREGKAQYTEKISRHIPSGWCVHSAFAHGHVPNTLKVYQGRDCVEKLVEYKQEEVKWMYAVFSEKPMIELTDALKTEHKAADGFMSRSSPQ